MKIKKKILLALLLSLLAVVTVIPQALAAETITITKQPQNRSFPENASASWSVEAAGDGLVYDWFIVYGGTAYNTKRSFAEGHPWQDGVSGDGYGCNDKGNVFFINGIGAALNGAQIYCVVSDGTYSVTSSAAYITVGAPASPPEIVVPAYAETEKGGSLELLCQAAAPEGDSIASYLWYETTTGKLEDIVAIGAKEGREENRSVLVCDTSKTGTRYYVCAVNTGKGGMGYSSVIAVTVKEAPATTAAPATTQAPETTKIPETTKVPETTKAPETGGTPATTAAAPATSVIPESTPTVTADAPESTNERADDGGIKPLTIALAAIGAAAVIGGTVTSILAAKRKKSDRDK